VRIVRRVCLCPCSVLQRWAEKSARATGMHGSSRRYAFTDAPAFLVGGIIRRWGRMLLRSHGDSMDKHAYPRWTRREEARDEEW